MSAKLVMPMHNRRKNTILTEVIYGVVNGVMVIPVSIAFCSIIFRDGAFDKVLPLLVKLVLFSSAIHQLCFTTFSSLPFSIGQVQDAGLIFLSSMASHIAANAISEKAIIPTTLITLSMATCLLGVFLYILGKLKLAKIIQNMPMPVVGGYLAFIGFFCFEAGLALMAGQDVTCVQDWVKLLSIKSLQLLIPGLSLGILVYYLLNTFHSPFILPSVLMLVVALFYLVLYITGVSIEESRERGWVFPISPSVSLLDSFQLYDFSLVEWKLVPQQVLRWLGMFLVVSFSSSLDVAAIEMELGLPLDYNRELETVGLSNLVSGLFGGFTGSYIFSQTIFCMKRGVQSRVCGYTVSLLEFAVLLLPFSVTSFVPKLFFGSLLVLIGLDLSVQWLLLSRHKMTLPEYLICIISFMAIKCFGIEIGMTIGITLSMFSFVFTYSTLPSVVVSSSATSTVIRTFEERKVLAQQRGKILTVSMSGYVFFGSSVKILEEVKSYITSSRTTSGDFDKAMGASSHDNIRFMMSPEKSITRRTLRESSRINGPNKDGVKKQEYGSVSYSLLQQSLVNDHSNSDAIESAIISIYDMSPGQINSHHKEWEVSKNRKSAHTRNAASPTFAILQGGVADLSTPSTAKSVHDNNDTTTCDDESSVLVHIFKSNEERDRNSLSAAKSTAPVVTEYIVLDFTNVLGIDATAARSCFLMLTQLLRASHVTITFTSMSCHVETILRAQGVINEDDIVIPHLDDTLEWCEEQVLYDEESCVGVSSHKSEFDRNLLYYQQAWLKRQSSNTRPTTMLQSLVVDQQQSMTNLHDFGCDLPVSSVRSLRRILEDYLEFNCRDDEHFRSATLVKYFSQMCCSANDCIFDFNTEANCVYFIEEGVVETITSSNGVFARVNKICQAGIFGEADFFLQKPHSVRALAVSAAKIWYLTRSNYVSMEVHHPKLLFLVQHCLLKSLSISSASTAVVA